MLQKIYWMLSLLVFTSISAIAQQTAETVEMADTFRAEGKIYVVITVVAIILVGLCVYMIMLDKKIGKLEKEHSDK